MIRCLFRNIIQFFLQLVICMQRFLYPLRKGAEICQISRICYRFKQPAEYVREENFLCGFIRYDPLRTVLDFHHVAIEYKPDYTVLSRSDKDIYNVEKYPFFYNAIFQESRQKILVPTEPFIELIESQPWPDVHLIFLWSTGRCGSTLLANLFTSFDNFCTISEPDDIFLTFESRQKMTSMLYEKCLTNSLKYHLIQVRKQKPSTKYVIIKTRNTWFWYITKSPLQIQDKITHIFMYRDLLPTVKSFQRVIEGLKSAMNSQQTLLEEAVEPLEKTLEQILELKPSVELVKSLRIASPDTMVRTTFAGVPYLLLLYQHLANRGYYKERLFAVKYEQLIADPVGQFEKIAKKMKSCGFSISNRERERLEVLSKKDSQENSPLSQKKLAKTFDISGLWKPEVEAILVEMMGACNLSSGLQENFLLPNTL